LGEHVDAGPGTLNLDRTASFSLLLSEPGVDFGGELVVDGEVAGLRRGDLLGFTAATPNAVRPVAWGWRLVLVGFGENRRAPLPG
jgi:hypothetical protein